MMLLTAALLVAANAPRHFVYNYRFGAAMQATQGFAPTVNNGDKSVGAAASTMGVQNFQSGATSGTITLDVVQAQAPDGSTVFKVSETGFNLGKTFMCAAYGQTGNVVCNADAPLRPDTLILLRVAGAGFYNPQTLDASKHWRIVSPGTNLTETADFTVTKVAGPLVTIAMKRHGTQQNPPLDSTIDGTVVYDTAAQAPQSIDVTMTLDPKQPGSHPVSSRIDLALQP